MIVDVDESPVGAGKTEKQIRRAVLTPARYLFVVERLNSMEELAARISSFSDFSINPVLIRGDDQGRGSSVRQAVEALPDQYKADHVIAICTHMAMTMSDLSEFHGWHIIIDEVPAALLLDEKQTKLDAHFFSKNYKLENVDDKWSSVTMTDDGFEIDGSDLQQDDSHRHLRGFHQRVRDASLAEGRPVLCNLAAWHDAERDNVTWTWWSLFSIKQLSAFTSVNFLGNNFMTSITAKMWQAWEPTVQWRPFKTSGTRALKNKRVTIRYYSDVRASLKFFKSENGTTNLKKIARSISSTASQSLIWTANTSIADELAPLLKGTNRLPPRQSGTGKYQHCDHAVAFFAAKPNPNVRAVLAAIGLTQDDWIISHEHETILQFVTRTSLRDVESDHDVIVDVYAKDQAQYLKSFFDAQPHISATLQFLDLDLETQQVKQAGRPKFTPEMAIIAQIERKKKDALRAKAYRARMAGKCQ